MDWEEIVEQLIGDNFETADWEEIIKQIISGNNLEDAKLGVQLRAVYDFIERRFSSMIEDGVEGFAYFGSAEYCNPAFKYVEGICNEGTAGFISDTEVGRLLNSDEFNSAMESTFDDKIVPNGENIKGIYDGQSKINNEVLNYTGKILFKDDSEAVALNDFVSECYIKNLKCSNVKTLMIGDFRKDANNLYNAFFRTELDAILANNNIETVNGIEKCVFQEIRRSMPTEIGNQYISDILKASQVDYVKDIYYIIDTKIFEGEEKLLLKLFLKRLIMQKEFWMIYYVGRKI